MPDPLDFLGADWPAPSTVHALTTTRANGVSEGPWRSLNLADHVGDDPGAVRRNRIALQRALALPAAPQWLQQVHGCAVAEAGTDGNVPTADACYTDRPGVVCAVLTADCLPVTLSDRAGREVAAVHCGWRGLAGGVLRATVARFRAPATELIAWMGPAIGPDAFEVGGEVRAAFLAAARSASQRDAVAAAFVPSPRAPGKLLADLYALARAECAALGVASVHGGGLCTVADAARFYSYRRDGVTGRMATLVWIGI